MAMAAGKFSGPYTYEQLAWMEQSGALRETSQVSVVGTSGEWSTWAAVRDKFAPREIPQARTVAGAVAMPVASSASEPSLSRSIYILLGLFLGTIGVHNFYAGHVVAGVAQVLLTVVGLVLFLSGAAIGAAICAIVGLWVLVEIVAQTKDGQGRPLK